MDEKEYKGLEDILQMNPGAIKYDQWGIKFNPFPRSGTSNINGGDEVNRVLKPLDSEIFNGINQFIANALVPNQVEEHDQFISATIVGDYGSGKTQLLMYAKSKLNEIRDSQTYLKPYTIYIDNPGGSILEFIGTLISKIGEENTRKYVWNHILNVIQNSSDIQEQLKPYEPNLSLLFPDMKDSINPYSDANTVSYKQFLDSFVRQMPAPQKRKFDDLLSDIVQKILNEDTKDSTVAYYFYEFISSDFGINKTWEALTSGSLRQISGKEADVIKYIVKLLKREGYTHVLWFDADMVFQDSVLDDLMFSGKPFVCGIFHARRKGYNSCLFRNLDLNHLERFEYPYPTDTFEVAGCGFGCVLIDVQIMREVMQKDGTCFLPMAHYGEDLAFCKRVAALGYKMYAEPSAVCGHIGHTVIYPEDHERWKQTISF